MAKKRKGQTKARADTEVERYEDRIDSDEEELVQLGAGDAQDGDGDEDGAGTGSGPEDEAARAPRTVNNTEMLLQREEDLDLGLGFEETLVVHTERVAEQTDLNPEDDLKREVAFYQQALAGVKAGREQLDELNVKHVRPVDYFAEMVKSDEHMARIKQQLLFEKHKMEAFEQRKKQQDYKRFAKQLQAEKLKDKAKKKKQAMADAKELKGIADESGELLRGAASGRSGKKRARDSSGLGEGASQDQGRGGARRRVNHKREVKNKKYGMGGRKRNAKRNTAESSGSTAEYSSRRNRSLPTGMRAGKPRGGKSNAGANRMGKSRRAKMRQGNK